MGAKSQRKSQPILSVAGEFSLMAVISFIFIISINSVNFNGPEALIDAVTPHRLVMYLYAFYFWMSPCFKI